MSSDDTKRPTTTEYGVVLTLERGSKFIWAKRRMVSWTPDPTSEDEAIEWARERYDGEIEEIHGVRSREVPAPEKWDDDDPRIVTDGGTIKDDTERLPEGALNVLDYSLWRFPADANRALVLATLRGEFPEEWMLSQPDNAPGGRWDSVRFCTGCKIAEQMPPVCPWCGSDTVVSADDVRELKRQANGVSSP